MNLKDSLEQYTEQEFLDFITGICKVRYPTEETHTAAVIRFNQLTEHPDGSDLIYYPAAGNDGTPESILQTVKEWRSQHGKAGFQKA